MELTSDLVTDRASSRGATAPKNQEASTSSYPPAYYIRPQPYPDRDTNNVKFTTFIDGKQLWIFYQSQVNFPAHS